MATSKIAQFELFFTQYLNEKSEAIGEWPAFANDSKTLVAMYEEMVAMRLFEQKTMNLQRSGKIGTFPPSKGHEALAVGVGFAMRDEDFFVPAYREYATQFRRGVRMRDIFALYGGDPRGHSFGPDCHDFPMTVPLATQTLHAAGVAFAKKYKKESGAVLTVLGDGASSEGDAYEAMNVAGIWQLPLVFVLNNNQWAISTPRHIQTAAETFAQKAIGCGFDGVVVDGNDPIAVRDETEKALNKARNGGGPTLIEAQLFRFCPHTTADDPTRYMTQQEHDEAWQKEPIARLRRYLESKNLWNEKKQEKLEARCVEEIASEVDAYLNMPVLKPTAMFDYLYEELPESLLEQYEELMEMSE